MWNNTKRFLIMASVALNIAFVGAWLVYANPLGLKRKETDQSSTTARIWCPLHEQLNVSDEQWRQIEPRLKEFRESAQSVSKQINGFRSEVLDMIAKPVPDREAIAAKQEQIRACRRKMQGMVVDHLLAEKKLLTDEQAEQLLALLREHSGGGRGDRAGLSESQQRGFGRVLREDGPTE